MYSRNQESAFDRPSPFVFLAKPLRALTLPWGANIISTGKQTAATKMTLEAWVLTTPPKHRTAKGEKANPPKKRGRPKKQGAET